VPAERRLIHLIGVWLAALTIAGCRTDRDETATPEARAATETNAVATTGSVDQPVHIAMRQVRLRMGQGIFLDVERLQGRMVSRERGKPPVFDDQESYTLAVDSAELSMSAGSVAALLNHRVFGRKGASLDDLELRTVGRELEVKGDLNKGIDIPFVMRATVGPGGGTRLRLRPTSLKTAGIPTKGILNFFGLELGDLIDTRKATGLAARDDDLFLDAAAALPPPRITGEITTVRVVDGRLLLAIAGGGEHKAAPPPHEPPEPDAHYIFFSGSDIRFGKLTMHDADLQLVDGDPSDPFDFSPEGYEEQLVAGYSKNQADGGLVTVMPDYGDKNRVIKN
jgi:hypothetical protein